MLLKTLIAKNLHDSKKHSSSILQ